MSKTIKYIGESFVIPHHKQSKDGVNDEFLYTSINAEFIGSEGTIIMCYPAQTGKIEIKKPDANTFHYPISANSTKTLGVGTVKAKIECITEDANAPDGKWVNIIDVQMFELRAK